jgi:anti-sigma B factor antagonist
MDDNETRTREEISDPLSPDEYAVTYRRLDVDQGLCVLEIHGDLDVAVARSLIFELDGLLEVGAPRVGVDLSGVPFMDSSALSALVRARERAAARGQRLDLLRPSPACAKVLSLTGLDHIFGVS